jgi:primase-polymerase (primpol)-like protein
MTLQNDLPPALTQLIAERRWVVWKWEPDKRGKLTKPPRQSRSHKHAKNNDPATWSSYEEARNAANIIRAGKHFFDGVGYNLLGSNILAKDIDHCRDPATGTLDPWAQNVIEQCRSYTEITPSGTGIRIIGLGQGSKLNKSLPYADGKDQNCEFYRDCERYITVTGNQIGNYPLADITEPFDRIYAELEARKKSKKKQSNGSTGEPYVGAHFSPWKDLNRQALANLAAWVPALFGDKAEVQASGGYRVSSAALDRDLEED